MNRYKAHRLFTLLLLLFIGSTTYSQVIGPLPEDSIAPIPSYAERSQKWGPNDTMIVSAIWYRNEMMPYKELDMVWVGNNMSPKKMQKYVEEWSRLRKAVYVTYTYARLAGRTINDINIQLTNVKDKKERKNYIKTREKDLKQQFGDPLMNMTVYQGKVLMKLINRQTGNNCYEILKEYKGGVNARFYQTLAFFVGGNLKQDWDLTDQTDRQIETFVKEIDGNWYGNPYRK